MKFWSFLGTLDGKNAGNPYLLGMLLYKGQLQNLGS